jgi:beta-lactamase superfamily II metal-dependent hydrolase
LLEIIFKDVGQGDSIFLSWPNDAGKTSYGIIDSHIYQSRNPILEELQVRNVQNLDFIIVSHMHKDHYSGVHEILEFCIMKGIVIEKFYHTFKAEYLKIMNDQINDSFTKAIFEKFWLSYQLAIDNGIIKDPDGVTHNTMPILLFKNVNLSFKSPNGLDERKLVTQQALYESKKMKAQPNINLVATIIEVSNQTKSILLTSDAEKHSFKRIEGKLSSTFELVQVPHHGSEKNHYPDFWRSIKKQNTCHSVFSVGSNDGDKLPKKNVVEFFDSTGFYNCSTNTVYGISEHYNLPPSISIGISRRNKLLNMVSKLKNASVAATHTSSRFHGDKLFKISM